MRPTVPGAALSAIAVLVLYRFAIELRQLLRLHEAQVPRRQLEPWVDRQAAEHRLGEAVVAGPPQRLRMPLAGDAVEHHPGDLDVVAMAAEALDQRRDRCPHAAGVHDEDHRQVEQAGKIGGRAVIVGGAVEQSHHALAQDEIGRARARVP